MEKINNIMSSFTFNILKRFHIISSEDIHGNISLFGAIGYAFKTLWKLLLFKYCYSSFILEPLNQKYLRAIIWRKLGCKIGNNVRIGHSVSLDYGNTDKILIEDNVAITNCCIILCHRRDMTKYRKNMDSSTLPFIFAPVRICKGVQIGMGAIIMPGVTIGEGSMIGAGAVVTKDIPAWSIAVGSPAKVIKEL